MGTLEKKKIVLGVCGGIAAYKSCELVRLLMKEGANVHVVMTKAAKEFVTPLTFQTLSGNPVYTDLFEDCHCEPEGRSNPKNSSINHIFLADNADLIVIAPATADFMAKAAHGLADDLLTNILLATKNLVVFCPSMNVNMWQHRATQLNVGRLKELGYHILEPAEGELACGWEGQGRLLEPTQVTDLIKKFLASKNR